MEHFFHSVRFLSFYHTHPHSFANARNHKHFATRALIRSKVGDDDNDDGDDDDNEDVVVVVYRVRSSAHTEGMEKKRRKRPNRNRKYKNEEIQ